METDHNTYIILYYDIVIIMDFIKMLNLISDIFHKEHVIIIMSEKQELIDDLYKSEVLDYVVRTSV